MTQGLAQARRQSIELRCQLGVQTANLGLETQTAASSLRIRLDFDHALRRALCQGALEVRRVRWMRDDADAARAPRFCQGALGQGDDA
jgi:hypothetical protein